MADSPPVFHFEMKQGFNVVRRFNLTRAQLQAMVLDPWVARQEISLDDRLWLPARTKLKILMGRPIETVEMGMGRGWTNAERAGDYVTEALLAAPKPEPAAAPPAADPGLEAFKAEVLSTCSQAPLTLAAVAAMAGVGHERWRVSEQLALAERAVWELLHQQRIALFTPEDLGAAPRERWQPVLLAWGSWGGAPAAGVTIESLPIP